MNPDIRQAVILNNIFLNNIPILVMAMNYPAERMEDLHTSLSQIVANLSVTRPPKDQS